MALSPEPKYVMYILLPLADDPDFIAGYHGNFFFLERNQVRSCGCVDVLNNETVEKENT